MPSKSVTGYFQIDSFGLDASVTVLEAPFSLIVELSETTFVVGT
jgi:hypothetical protein